MESHKNPSRQRPWLRALTLSCLIGVLAGCVQRVGYQSEGNNDVVPPPGDRYVIPGDDLIGGDASPGAPCSLATCPTPANGCLTATCDSEEVPHCSYALALDAADCITVGGAPGHCLDGVCVACTRDEECDDANPCTDQTCDPDSHACITLLHSRACDDEDPCTSDDRCALGECIGTTLACPNGCMDGHCVGAWLDPDWSHRTRVSVSTQATGTQSTLDDFPVFVDLRDVPTSFWNHVRTDGADLVVTGADGTTRLSREIVLGTFSTSTHLGELYFRAPHLLPSVSNDFYIYVGNPSALETSDTSTWASHYVGVWHMESLPPSDSSTFANHADTVSGDVSVEPGLVYNGIHCDGSGDFVQVPHDSSLDPGTADLTVSISHRLSPDAAVFHGLISKGGSAPGVPGWALVYHQPFLRMVFYFGDTNDRGTTHSSTAEMTRGQWKRSAIVLDRDGLTYHLLNGGIFSSGKEFSAYSGDVTQPSYALSLCSWNGAYSANGLIDEVRVSKIKLSNDWLRMETLNLHHRDEVYSVGDLEPAP